MPRDLFSIPEARQFVYDYFEITRGKNYLNDNSVEKITNEVQILLRKSFEELFSLIEALPDSKQKPLKEMLRKVKSIVNPKKKEKVKSRFNPKAEEFKPISLPPLPSLDETIRVNIEHYFECAWQVSEIDGQYSFEDLAQNEDCLRDVVERLADEELIDEIQYSEYISLIDSISDLQMAQ